MKRRAILSLFAAIPLAATVALAGSGGECGHEHGGGPKGEHGSYHGRDHGMHFRKHFDELGLSPEQKTKVDAIFESSRKEREASHGKSREAYKKLHEMLEQDKPDEKAILAKVDEIGEMKTEAHKSMLKTLLAVSAELTPEQRKKLKEMKSERGDRHRHHRGKGDAKDEPKSNDSTKN